MKKSYSKSLVAAVLLGLSVSVFGVAAAAPAENSVSVKVEVNQPEKCQINWTKGSDADIEAIGVGLPPENANPTRGKALARRGAIMDAQRSLMETVQGVQVDSESTMQDLTVVSDTVKSKVSAIVKGARVVEEKYNADGSYNVKMVIPMYGSKGLAAVAIPEITKELPKTEFPEVSEEFKPAEEVKEALPTCTGVVVDAAGMGLEPTFSAAIYDINGRVVYGLQNLDYDKAISIGVVDYANGMSQVSASSRAGANALVVKAVALKQGKSSSCKVNVVVSVEDADKILAANEKTGMLKNQAVVFVK